MTQLFSYIHKINSHYFLTMTPDHKSLFFLLLFFYIWNWNPLILDLRTNVRGKEILSSWEQENQRVHVGKNYDGPCSHFSNFEHSKINIGSNGGKTFWNLGLEEAENDLVWRESCCIIWMIGVEHKFNSKNDQSRRIICIISKTQRIFK